MRHDLFHGKKSVHVKLTKESHAALREKLFRYGLTMQDLFQESAEMIIANDDRSEKLLQRIAKKKLASSLQKLDRQNKLVLREFDSETLYNLLEVEVPDGTKEKQ